MIASTGAPFVLTVAVIKKALILAPGYPHHTLKTRFPF